MKKNLFLLGLLVCSMATMAQTEKADKPESWYFKLGGSYFNQTASTEFPVVGGQLPNRDVYAGTLANNKLVSRESVTGSFGQGFRSGITAGYRFSTRLGVEMSANYYISNEKTMAQTTNRLISYNPATSPVATYVSFTAEGQIKAFDLAPAIVMFLGEAHGFEPYTKVGVIVPIHGTLDIKTDRQYTSFAGANQVAATDAYSKDVVKPNATLGFMAALGTSYKLGKHISAFAELEYRNFTVHGKSKETTIYTENGVDKLNTNTNFRVGSTASNHTHYVDHLDTTSNNALTNPNGVDQSKPMDELSSYVGISGLGLTVGLKYSL
ncbi:Outer membrane protein beta-barrel domain-containing protein [Flavobacterium resistens]|uniref:Outer membrane beta-barrel protein n=1 Tax=Flavobacterium resistens TaxID=443612 RepID=A0A521C9R4_9FLAO|nr:outer membrane beta-barrel protein [Flavobacterium resistens]MRX66445.1 outer membrane beta-barrel protein [Flavobacterium resistens]SMO56138.1 Outer membrane protein beta-barrel domain-containing protein [Flavobacterium resistens]